MTFEINNENINENLTNNNIVITPEFIERNNLIESLAIKIKNIQDKSIKVIIVNVINVKLSIEIKDCSLYGCFIEKCTLKEFHFLNVEISKPNVNKFKPYNVYFDNSKLDSIWAMECKFYEGFLIRNNSEIKSIRFNDSLIDNSLTFINSKAESLEIESSHLEYLNIDRSDYPVPNSVTVLDKINIFRTTINLGFKIWDVKFKTINIHKIIVSEVTNLSDHQKSIHISTPKDYKEIETIEIGESNFERDLIISVDNIKKMVAYNNTFDYLRINFWKINEFRFSTNTVSENFFLGFQNHQKQIEKFSFSNNTFDGDFYISDIVFKNEFYLTSSTFNKYPSFIESCYFENDCKTDFEFSNFTNLIFQDINFESVSFKNFDIINSTFKNCEWKVEKYFFYKKYLIHDESNKKLNKLEDLIHSKKVYSNLKSNFQDKNDFINSSRFYISEQDIKRKITLKNKSFLEYFILSIHKSLSVYGESLTKIVSVLALSLLIFSIIYFFSGFKSGNETVNYALKFDANNFTCTIKDFIKALILSVKNIVPFTLNNNFFINTNENFSITQTFELIQKFFNFIILASFTETFVKYLKK